MGKAQTEDKVGLPCLHSLFVMCVCSGDSQPMDACSVHHNNTFLRYSVSLLGYGFYGDVLTDSERKRWMGPARYDLSGRNKNVARCCQGKSVMSIIMLKCELAAGD